MNKNSAIFKLTELGLLPRKSSLSCEVNGIYVFLHKNEVIRFGESGSGFERIKKGFNHQLRKGNGKKNYTAYHFREKYKEQEIEIRYYTSKNNILSTAEFRRAIEAELAYQFRLKKGRWPEAMIEIHFFNDLNEEQTKFVEFIISDIGI